VHARDPVLDAVNVQAALGQLDLLPLQVAHLGGPQTVAVGDQDHGRVAMPVAAMLAGVVHQPLDFALGEIASFNCQVYDVWRALLGCRFYADKLCLRVPYCIGYTPFLHSQSTARRRLASLPMRPYRSPSNGGVSGCGLDPPGVLKWRTCAGFCRARARQARSPRYALHPPVGGTFHFENLVMPPLPKTCPKMVSAPKWG
jgi:hypothetical protein